MLGEDHAATSVAPHVRDATNVADLMRTIVLASVPCVLVGAWSTGRQASTALLQAEANDLLGWRAGLLSGLGVEVRPENVPACLALGALYFVPLLVAAAVATVGCEHAFARLRRRPASEGAFVTALVFTLLLSPGTPPWQAAIGASFGIVFGKLVFGGIGRSFLNPSVVGLAYLAVAHPETSSGSVSFPGIAGHSGTDLFARAAVEGVAAVHDAGLTWWGAFLGSDAGRLGETSTFACLLGAAYLVHRRVASWRVMAAVILGASAVAASSNLLRHDEALAALLPVPWHWHVVLGGLAFTAVFVAADPVSAPVTGAGRWIFGLFVGAAVVLLRLGSPRHPDGVVAAVLLGNVAAPLVDHLVIRWNVGQRRRRSRLRHG